METDKAIEKMAEYRKDTQEKTDQVQRKKKDLSPLTKKLRSFFMKYYWFNAVFITAIGFSMMFKITGASGFSLFFYVILTGINFILMRQCFVTIERLEKSDGRNIIFDDVFLVLLTIVSFYELLPVLDIDISLFITIHVILTIFWVLQIYFVNFKKPELEYAASKGPKVEEVPLTLKERIQGFFTVRRVIVIILGFAGGFALSFSGI